MTKIEIGKPQHCVELVTGENLTGNMLLSDETIRADIYSFADFFHIKGEQPVFLQTAENYIVSFHSNVTTSAGSNSRNIEPKRTTYHQEIVSNVAVIGHDAWKAGDRVKRAVFQVTHTKQLMHHEEKISAIGQRRFPGEDHFTLFKDIAEGVTLKAWYGATYGMDFDAPKDLWPTFEIEFEDPRSIQDYIQSVSDYVGFLSFCFGVRLKPSAIRIDRLSFADMMAAIEKREYPGDHDVHYVWPEVEIDNHDLWVGGSPVRSWNDEELTAFRACLVSWMNRATAWRRPYTLMMASFGLNRVVSSERLLNACRWFEDMPIAKAQPVLSQDDVDTIAAAAASKAQELGLSLAIAERIAGAIRWIRVETAEQQFKRLISLVEAKFGSGVLPPEAVDHLKRAINFRGKSAHGHFHPENDVEFRAFSKSTRAMEALCYLLTGLDLPISAEGSKRVWSNPVLRDYRLAYD